VTSDDLVALAPLILVALAALAVVLGTALRRSHRFALGSALLGLGLAAAALPRAAALAPRVVSPILIVDQYALFFTGLILATCLVLCVLAYGYLERRTAHREEFYALLLISALGAMVLAASNHFVSLFLGLETLSVGIYVLVSYFRTTPAAVEAGLKYLILAGASSAFLVLGMALMYAELGTLDFEAMAARLTPETAGLALPGLALVLVGFGFKLAVVPFHMWTPDVYEGAPAPVTAFVATVSKGGVFALLLRLFAELDGRDLYVVELALGAVAVASMLAGNLLALLQDNVKRLLAYSSIAHLGYLLVAFLADRSLGVEAAAFYLVAYFVTTLAGFGIVTVLSDGERDADRSSDYAGLYWRRPWLAALLTAVLLSLAGLPLTAGFLAKFFVVTAGVDASRWVLVGALVAGSAIGLYYYLRLIVVMLDPSAGREGAPGAPAAPRVGRGAAGSLALLAVLLFWLGVDPSPLVRLIAVSVAALP
jgi:NADH-quinone oxidoreductase subunit N